MIEKHFLKLPEVNPDEISPAVWAYVGDAVYELYIRHRLLAGGATKTRSLHHEATKRVRATFQAQLAGYLEPILSESELEVLRRGRNVKSGHTPANTAVLAYRHSTAFEALIGYLYLKKNYARLEEILEKVAAFSGEE